MNTFKYVLLTIYVIVCVILILITTFQTKDSDKSIDDTYENPRANKYFDKNKSRTKDGRIEKRTIIISTIFIVLTIITTVVCFL